MLLVYVAGYAGLRFVLEMFRGDLSRRFLFQLRAPGCRGRWACRAGDPLLLSTGQVVSVVLLAAAIVVWRRQRAGGLKATSDLRVQTLTPTHPDLLPLRGRGRTIPSLSRIASRRSL